MFTHMSKEIIARVNNMSEGGWIDVVQELNGGESFHCMTLANNNNNIAKSTETNWALSLRAGRSSLVSVHASRAWHLAFEATDLRDYHSLPTWRN